MEPVQGYWSKLGAILQLSATAVCSLEGKLKVELEAGWTQRGRRWWHAAAEGCFGVFFCPQESHTEEHEGEEQVHEQPQQQEEYWFTQRLWQFSFCVRTFFWRMEHVWPQTWNQFTPSLPLTFMYHSECQPTTAFCTHTLPRCVCRSLLSVYPPERL